MKFLIAALLLTATIGQAQTTPDIDTRKDDKRFAGTFAGQTPDGDSCEIKIAFDDDKSIAVNVPGSLAAFRPSLDFADAHYNPTVYNPNTKVYDLAKAGYGMSSFVKFNRGLPLENFIYDLKVSYADGSSEPKSFTVIRPAVHQYRIQGISDKLILDCRNLQRTSN